MAAGFVRSLLAPTIDASSRMAIVFFKNQDFRTELSGLKRLCFLGAQVGCIIRAMRYGYARVSTDGQALTAQVLN